MFHGSKVEAAYYLAVKEKLRFGYNVITEFDLIVTIPV